MGTATPGGHIDTTEYDKFGNTIRTLQATDREIALASHPKATTYLADLGLSSLNTSDRAQALCTVNIYSTDGLNLLSTTGPAMRIVLGEGQADPDAGGPLTAIAAGSTTVARAHTVNVYDENKPDGATHHLLTTTKSGAAIPGYPDADPAPAPAPARCQGRHLRVDTAQTHHHRRGRRRRWSGLDVIRGV